MNTQMFPIIGSRHSSTSTKAWFPLKVLSPHAKQTSLNHAHSLQQMSERGGMTPAELAAVLEDRPFVQMSDREAWYSIFEAVERHLKPMRTVTDADILRDGDTIHGLYEEIEQLRADLEEERRRE